MTRDLAREFIENKPHVFEPYNASWVMPRCKVCKEFEDHPIHEKDDSIVLAKTETGTINISYLGDELHGVKAFSIMQRIEEGPLGQPIVIRSVIKEGDAQRLAQFINEKMGDKENE